MVNVHGIFKSIQGEGCRAGYPFIFVRLAGCNLRCSYCDTPDTFEEGSEQSVIEISDRIADLSVPRVMVTGGEPLMQKDGSVLVDALIERNLQVVLETNGTYDLSGINKRCRIVMDIKTPGSGEDKNNKVMNLMWLKANDEIKLVLTGREDYVWARDFCVQRGLLDSKWIVHFSPAWGQLDPGDLAGWILQDRLNVRINLQLHKIIWPNGEKVESLL